MVSTAQDVLKDADMYFDFLVDVLAMKGKNNAVESNLTHVNFEINRKYYF